MWAIILGAPGSGKHEAAKYLAKQGFVYDEESCLDFSDTWPPAKIYDFQLDLMLSRYRAQRDLQARSRDEDIISLSSFWDVHEVYSTVLSKMMLFEARDFLNLSRTYKALCQTLDSPQKVIYMVNSKIDAEAKMALRQHRMLNEEFYDAITSEFKRFVEERIRCPYQEIDISGRPFDGVLSEVNAALSYMDKNKAVSIWQKAFLK